LIGNGDQFGVNLKGAQPVEYHFGMMPSDGMNDPIAGDGILGVGDAAGSPPRWWAKASAGVSRLA